MEYKLNKIDTDLRMKIQEETSKNKVHYSKKSNEVKDTVEERKNSFENFSENRKNHHKKYFTIEGIKHGEEIGVEAEKIEKMNEYNSKGRTIDIRK